MAHSIDACGDPVCAYAGSEPTSTHHRTTSFGLRVGPGTSLKKDRRTIPTSVGRQSCSTTTESARQWRSVLIKSRSRVSYSCSPSRNAIWTGPPNNTVGSCRSRTVARQRKQEDAWLLVEHLGFWRHRGTIPITGHVARARESPLAHRSPGNWRLAIMQRREHPRIFADADLPDAVGLSVTTSAVIGREPTSGEFLGVAAFDIHIPLEAQHETVSLSGCGNAALSNLICRLGSLGDRWPIPASLPKYAWKDNTTSHAPIPQPSWPRTANARLDGVGAKTLRDESLFVGRHCGATQCELDGRGERSTMEAQEAIARAVRLDRRRGGCGWAPTRANSPDRRAASDEFSDFHSAIYTKGASSRKSDRSHMRCLSSARDHVGRFDRSLGTASIRILRPHACCRVT